MSTSSPCPVLFVPALRFRARALRSAARAIVAVLLVTPSAFAAEAPDTTPEAVEMRRVLGTIEDRVRIDLETAGGELERSKIEIRVTPDRVVRLEGRVPSPEAKMRAGQVALYAVGVSTVDNQLEVDTRLAPPPPPPAVGAAAQDADPEISDEELATRVARRIAESLPVEARAKNRWLGGWQVAGEGWSFDVDVDDGKVRLDGRIREPVEIDELVARARAIPAVRSVDTSLTIVQ
jgi:osmotically-inducible protein OsmY